MSLGSERSEGPSSVESFAGVSLVQLAAIAAARAQGFPLEEILNAEGLEMDAYRAADIEYKCRLADSGERERLTAAYQAELSRAEDRLQRQISPLDDDIESWVRFLGTYGEQSSPAEWLTALGLTSTDLSRLSRIWEKRLDTDVALGKRAEKLAKQKRPYDISSLRVALAKLVPSPLAKSQTKSSLRDTAPLPADAMLLVHSWLPRTEPPPELTASESHNLGRQVDFPAKLQPLVPLSMTNPVFSLPEDDGLPFVKAPDVPNEPATPEERAAAMAPPREALSGTSLAVDIPRGPATPFEKLDKPLKEKEPEVKPAGAALGGTSLALEIPRGPATPFEKLDKPGQEKLPAVKPVPDELGETSLTVDIPRESVLPFASAKQELSRPPLTLEKHAAMTVEIATYPARTLAILKQYGLAPPQKVDLDQHYQRIVTNDPAKQAAWHAAYNAHYVTLMRAPRR
ncbi:MAG TPA: hypothetical protein PK156_03340 [Polyangium sp.]|nr:hypothetical protein [Polyangium sp.]